MFVLGLSEPWKFGLLRQTAVWCGSRSGETATGLDASHPTCRVLEELAATTSATWLRRVRTASLTPFKHRAERLALEKHGWHVDPNSEHCIRASRVARELTLLPFMNGVPRDESVALVLGANASWSWLHDAPAPARASSAMLSEELLHDHDFRGRLPMSSAVVGVGRSSSSNNPVVSLISREDYDLQSHVAVTEVLAVHTGADAARVWEYLRTPSA